VGCGEGIRRYTPYLWNGMLMALPKPESNPASFQETSTEIQCGLISKNKTKHV